MLRLWCILLLAVYSSSPVSAHDLYLLHKPAGQKTEVCAAVGEHFPASMNAVTADRLSSFRVRPAAGQPQELKGEVRAKEKEFCAPLPAPAPAIVEMTVQPRYIRLKADDFNGYIKGEGFKKVIQAREQGQETKKEGLELYSRFSKLLVGRGGDYFTKPIGHILEIVPERDPATLKPGDPLTVTVLFRGKPLADVQVAAMYANAKVTGHEFPITTRTDENGQAVLKLDRGGLWYARLIHMTPAVGDPEIDWRSYFATLTFEVPK